jgi:hypothetical protein
VIEINETGFTFDLLMKTIEEKDFGQELIVAILSNGVAMVFIIIGAIIVFWLKNYILKLCCMVKTDLLEEDKNKNEAKDDTIEVIP